MQFRILSAILFAMIMLLAACSPEHSKMVVAEYGDNEITLGEFEKAYAKNAGGYEEAKLDSLDELKKFLDLYLNFRMKLKDADVRDYDKDEALNAELDDYRNKVGVTYLKEKWIVEPGLKALYDKRKEEVRVSHIMIRTERRSKEDAKKMADNLLDSIKAGKTFEYLAEKYSEDQFSKVKGGDIYYITGGQIIPSFEEAAYACNKGEIYPEAVETRYGYHIVKVTDRRERVDQVKASHILFMFKDESGKVDSAAALNEATAMLDSLKAGKDFAEMATKYSDDKGSAQRGGDLGFFGRRRMVPEFDEASFNLKVGELSGLVETRYGYHIIKLFETKPVPAFEEEKETLKKLYQKNYFPKDYDAFIDSLKIEYAYKVNENNLALTYADADSVVNSDYEKIGNWSTVKDSVVAAYSNKELTVDSLLSFIAGQTKYKNRFIDSTLVATGLTELAKEKLSIEKVQALETLMPEFGDLMADYRNGIYIFKLQEEEVWNKVTVDSADLHKYWENTKENYTWPDRAEYLGFFSKQDSSAKKYHAELMAGADFDSLANAKSERAAFGNRKAFFGVREVEKDELAKIAFGLDKDGELSEPVKYKNGWYILKLVKKLPAGLKTFEEAKAEAASSYQEKQSKKLEEDYLAKLRKLYEPELKYETLEKAYKPEPAE